MTSTKLIKMVNAKDLEKESGAGGFNDVCAVRLPTYPSRTIFGDAWLACLVEGEFVLDSEKMLKAVELLLDCSDRKHRFFVDMKQYLYMLWPVEEFKVRDSDYPDNVGAQYPKISEFASHEAFTSKFLFNAL